MFEKCVINLFECLFPQLVDIEEDIRSLQLDSAGSI